MESQLLYCYRFLTGLTIFLRFDASHICHTACRLDELSDDNSIHSRGGSVRRMTYTRIGRLVIDRLTVVTHIVYVTLEDAASMISLRLGSCVLARVSCTAYRNCSSVVRYI